MKILLLGEYSGLHWNLAQGLEQLGHSVTVASDGDGFKDFPRDIDFSLKSDSTRDKILCCFSIIKSLRNLKGYDVVQIVNPCFTRIHPINIYLYRFLKKYNKKIFLGAFGDDYYYVKMCLENKKLRYSEFFINGKANPLQSNEDLKSAWLYSYRKKNNIEIANTCDGIIACLYEYYVAYEDEFKDKLSYIPLPINLKKIDYKETAQTPEVVRFFIGINKSRKETKGSDLFLEALICLKRNYPNEVEIVRVDSAPFEQYVDLLDDSHVVLDQIYSYSPAMNGLLSLAKGKILVGGGEPEMYDLLEETQNKPIINIEPTIKSIYTQLEYIVLNKSDIPNLSKKGQTFANDHFDYKKVAQNYLKFWTR